jgi:biopolymer transport protein ExbD
MSLKKTTRRGHSTLNELNITPLLDLVFVLLVIFIITTPQMVNNLEMFLPSGKPPPPANRMRHARRSIASW